jgi:hypothetical protein
MQAEQLQWWSKVGRVPVYKGTAAEDLVPTLLTLSSSSSSRRPAGVAAAVVAWLCSRHL